MVYINCQSCFPDWGAFRKCGRNLGRNRFCFAYLLLIGVLAAEDLKERYSCNSRTNIYASLSNTRNSSSTQVVGGLCRDNINEFNTVLPWEGTNGHWEFRNVICMTQAISFGNKLMMAIPFVDNSQLWYVYYTIYWRHSSGTRFVNFAIEDRDTVQSVHGRRSHGRRQKERCASGFQVSTIGKYVRLHREATTSLQKLRCHPKRRAVLYPHPLLCWQPKICHFCSHGAVHLPTLARIQLEFRIENPRKAS